MASYSKIYKASNLSLKNENRVLSQPRILFPVNESETERDESLHIEKASIANQLLLEAEEKAKRLMEEAKENVQLMELAAQEKINAWWEDNKKKLDALSLEAEQDGYQKGQRKGAEDAEAEVLQIYHERLEKASQIIEEAYAQKEKIISEAEPFLLELSTAIASQIVRQELKGNPDTFIELIKHQLLRFKEKEFITVCVHPEDFDFVQSERPQLIALVNGETEIKVIPDHSVTPKGCVIRTAYGSVDARIDTQIEEIKKVIQGARREPESGANS